jgi:hypothetical protein
VAGTAASVVLGCALAALATPDARAAYPLSWSSVATGAGPLSAISCPSESLCVAVESGGRILRTLDPAAPTPSWGTAFVAEPGLKSVSCTTQGLCVAVGGHEGHEAFTSHDSGASWSPAPAADTKGALTGVACVGPLCVAVDSAGRALATENPGASNWPASEIDPGTSLQSVACSTASSCVAVDAAGRAFGSERPLSGAWAHRRIGVAPLAAVSCAPSGPCAAVDGEGDALVSANAASPGSTWLSTPVTGSALGAVSCAASGLCVAVDEHGDAFASDNPLSAVPTWSVSSTAGGASLTGVSCVAGGICTAVDAAGRAWEGRLPPPEVATAPPAEASASEATLAGVVNPHDALLTSCTFEYGASAAYGQSVPCASLPAAAGGPQVITATIGGLQPNTTYHYRLLAGSLTGLREGADQTFTTAVSSAVARVTPHPSIHGTPAVGSHLTCSSGVASGSARVSFVWLRDLIPIARATGPAYTVAGTDSGHHLQCEVTASNAGGTVSARSTFVTIPIQGVVAAAGETVVGTARSVRGGVRIPVRCSLQSAGCRISIRLRAGHSTIGSLRTKLARGQHRNLVVRLNSAGRRLAAHAHRAVALLTVTGTVIGVIEALLSRQRVRL